MLMMIVLLQRQMEAGLVLCRLARVSLGIRGLAVRASHLQPYRFPSTTAKETPADRESCGPQAQAYRDPLYLYDSSTIGWVVCIVLILGDASAINNGLLDAHHLVHVDCSLQAAPHIDVGGPYDNGC